MQRMQFGRPNASFQLQQQKLATMALEVNRATLVALHSAASRIRDCYIRSRSAWASSAT